MNGIKLAMNNKSHINKKILIIFSVIYLSLIGCKKEEIKVYIIPKERPKNELALPQKNKSLNWKKPNHWIQKPKSGMRLASFTINNKQDKTAEVSITSFPGSVGSLEANINRWRGQLGLEPANESELGKSYSKIIVNDKNIVLVEIASKSLVMQERFKGRMIVAIVHEKNEIYFFKLIGVDELVLQERASFLSFLESINFE